MNLDDTLYDEIVARGGRDMKRLLGELKEGGLPRNEAEKAMLKVCARLDAEGREKDEDLATDWLMVTQNFCHERSRIWPNE